MKRQGSHATSDGENSAPGSMTKKRRPEPLALTNPDSSHISDALEAGERGSLFPPATAATASASSSSRRERDQIISVTIEDSTSSSILVPKTPHGVLYSPPTPITSGKPPIPTMAIGGGSTTLQTPTSRSPLVAGTPLSPRPAHRQSPAGGQQHQTCSIFEFPQQLLQHQQSLNVLPPVSPSSRSVSRSHHQHPTSESPYYTDPHNAGGQLDQRSAGAGSSGRSGSSTAGLRPRKGGIGTAQALAAVDDMEVGMFRSRSNSKDSASPRFRGVSSAQQQSLRGSTPGKDTHDNSGSRSAHTPSVMHKHRQTPQEFGGPDDTTGGQGVAENNQRPKTPAGFIDAVSVSMPPLEPVGAGGRHHATNSFSSTTGSSMFNQQVEFVAVAEMMGQQRHVSANAVNPNGSLGGQSRCSDSFVRQANEAERALPESEADKSFSLEPHNHHHRHANHDDQMSFQRQHPGGATSAEFNSVVQSPTTKTGDGEDDKIVRSAKIRGCRMSWLFFVIFFLSLITFGTLALVMEFKLFGMMREGGTHTSGTTATAVSQRLALLNYEIQSVTDELNSIPVDSLLEWSSSSNEGQKEPPVEEVDTSHFTRMRNSLCAHFFSGVVGYGRYAGNGTRLFVITCNHTIDGDRRLAPESHRQRLHIDESIPQENHPSGVDHRVKSLGFNSLSRRDVTFPIPIVTSISGSSEGGDEYALFALKKRAVGELVLSNVMGSLTERSTLTGILHLAPSRAPEIVLHTLLPEFPQYDVSLPTVVSVKLLDAYTTQCANDLNRETVMHTVIHRDPSMHFSTLRVSLGPPPDPHFEVSGLNDMPFSATVCGVVCTMEDNGREKKCSSEHDQVRFVSITYLRDEETATLTDLQFGASISLVIVLSLTMLILQISVGVPSNYLHWKIISAMTNTPWKKTRWEKVLYSSTKWLWIGDMKALIRSFHIMSIIFFLNRRYVPENVLRKQLRELDYRGSKLVQQADEAIFKEGEDDDHHHHPHQETIETEGAQQGDSLSNAVSVGGDASASAGSLRASPHLGVGETFQPQRVQQQGRGEEMDANDNEGFMSVTQADMQAFAGSFHNARSLAQLEDLAVFSSSAIQQAITKRGSGSYQLSETLQVKHASLRERKKSGARTVAEIAEERQRRATLASNDMSLSDLSRAIASGASPSSPREASATPSSFAQDLQNQLDRKGVNTRSRRTSGTGSALLRPQLTSFFGDHEDASVLPHHQAMNCIESATLLAIRIGNVERAYTTDFRKAAPQHRQMFSIITSIVRQMNGEVFHIRGDVFCVAWNAFDTRPDHTIRCVRCASMIAATFAPLKEQGLEVGIAVHQGPVICGSMSDHTMTTNVLFGAAAEFLMELSYLAVTGLHCCDVIISEIVKREVSIYFECLIVDVVQDSRGQLVQLFNLGQINETHQTPLIRKSGLASFSGTRFEEYSRLYNTAFTQFRSHHFVDALNVLKVLRTQHGSSKIEERLTLLCDGFRFMKSTFMKRHLAANTHSESEHSPLGGCEAGRGKTAVGLTSSAFEGSTTGSSRVETTPLLPPPPLISIGNRSISPSGLLDADTQCSSNDGNGSPFSNLQSLPRPYIRRLPVWTQYEEIAFRELSQRVGKVNIEHSSCSDGLVGLVAGGSEPPKTPTVFGGSRASQPAGLGRDVHSPFAKVKTPSTPAGVRGDGKSQFKKELQDHVAKTSEHRKRGTKHINDNKRKDSTHLDEKRIKASTPSNHSQAATQSASAVPASTSSPQQAPDALATTNYREETPGVAEERTKIIEEKWDGAVEEEVIPCSPITAKTPMSPRRKTTSHPQVQEQEEEPKEKEIENSETTFQLPTLGTKGEASSGVDKTISPNDVGSGGTQNSRRMTVGSEHSHCNFSDILSIQSPALEASSSDVGQRESPHNVNSNSEASGNNDQHCEGQHDEPVEFSFRPSNENVLAAIEEGKKTVSKIRSKKSSPNSTEPATSDSRDRNEERRPEFGEVVLSANTSANNAVSSENSALDHSDSPVAPASPKQLGELIAKKVHEESHRPQSVSQMGGDSYELPRVLSQQNSTQNLTIRPPSTRSAKMATVSGTSSADELFVSGSSGKSHEQSVLVEKQDMEVHSRPLEVRSETPSEHDTSGHFQPIQQTNSGMSSGDQNLAAQVLSTSELLSGPISSSNIFSAKKTLFVPDAMQFMSRGQTPPQSKEGSQQGTESASTTPKAGPMMGNLPLHRFAEDAGKKHHDQQFPPDVEHFGPVLKSRSHFPGDASMLRPLDEMNTSAHSVKGTSRKKLLLTGSEIPKDSEETQADEEMSDETTDSLEACAESLLDPEDKKRLVDEKITSRQKLRRKLSSATHLRSPVSNAHQAALLRRSYNHLSHRALKKGQSMSAIFNQGNRHGSQQKKSVAKRENHQADGSGLKSPLRREAGSSFNELRSMVMSNSTSLSGDTLGMSLKDVSFDHLPTEIECANGSHYMRSDNVLGVGSYGKVYMGMEQHTSKLVAMKFMPLPNGEEDREKIETEVHIMENVHDQYLVDFYSYAFSDTKIVLVLECLVAGSLFGLLKSFGRLTEATAVNYTKDVLRGLLKLHSEGLIHRDVKPQNVLVAVTGRCKISDFGASACVSELAYGGIIQGTPAYLSPEAARGKPTTKSDIWSVGVMFLQLITGKLPYMDTENALFNNPMLLVYQIGAQIIIPDIPPDLSPMAREFVELCLTDEVDKRASCDELLDLPLFSV